MVTDETFLWEGKDKNKSKRITEITDANNNNNRHIHFNIMGGAVASWLVRSTPDQVDNRMSTKSGFMKLKAICKRRMAGDIVLCSLLLRYLSPPRCINGYWRNDEPCVGLASHPGGSKKNTWTP